VAALPPPDAAADDGITCDFLLRLLRAGSMVGADAALLRELEARAARRLDQASLAAVMVPASGHAPATLLDVPLVLRLVRGFLKEGGKGAGGGASARVARLVDAYLAEAALEAGLRPAELEELARAVPAHARAADDALYRAVDTYLKVTVHATHSLNSVSVFIFR
jgi:putative intracellular protease/amidase